MLVRRIKKSTNGGLHEWVFCRGLSAYVGQQEAVKQDILTSLYCFTNDCFYDLNFGIDWLTRLGYKNQKDLLDTDIQDIINDRAGVIRVQDFSSTLVGRAYSCSCKVYTEYSQDFIDLDFSNEV